jgi:hypothetical protein
LKWPGLMCQLHKRQIISHEIADRCCAATKSPAILLVQGYGTFS